MVKPPEPIRMRREGSGLLEGVLAAAVRLLLGATIARIVHPSPEPQGVTGHDLHLAFIRCGGTRHYSTEMRKRGEPDPAVVCTQAIYGGGAWRGKDE